MEEAVGGEDRICGCLGVSHGDKRRAGADVDVAGAGGQPLSAREGGGLPGWRGMRGPVRGASGCGTSMDVTATGGTGMRDVEWGGDRAASLPPPLCADGGDFHSTRQGSRPPLSARECLLIVFFLGSLPSLLRLRIWKPPTALPRRCHPSPAVMDRPVHRLSVLHRGRDAQLYRVCSGNSPSADSTHHTLIPNDPLAFFSPRRAQRAPHPPMQLPPCGSFLPACSSANLKVPRPRSPCLPAQWLPAIQML